MVHLLFFSVEGIRGAIPLDDSMYLVRMVALSQVEDTSQGIIGTLCIHGISMPVYSLRQLFGFHNRPPRLNDNLIITHIGPSRVALWVDETFVVQDVDDISDDLSESSCNHFIIPGIRVLSDGRVLIHDLTLFLESRSRTVVTPVSSLIKGQPDVMMTDLNLDNRIVDHHAPDVIRGILVERAEELAKSEGKRSDTSSIEILKFRLMYREYAVEMKYVREVVLSREITPVPGTPEHLIGICPIRGEIIPLVDLRVLLSIPERGLTDFNQVIVLTNGEITFGILADQITGIRTIPAHQILPADTGISPGKPGYIFGVDTCDMIIINASAILTDPTIIVDSSRETDPGSPSVIEQV